MRRMLILGCIGFAGMALASPQAARAFVAAPPAASASGGDVLAEAAPAYTQAQAEAWAASVIPVLEEVAQRKFFSKPEIRVVDRETLAKSMRKDLTAQLKVLKPNANLDKIDAAIEFNVGGASRRRFARFMWQDGVIMLPAGNLAPLMAYCGIPTEKMPSMMTLALAQELAHALQDQIYGLSTLESRVKTADGMIASSATIEGHALYLTELVAGRLGLDGDFRSFQRLLLGERDVRGDDEPALEQPRTEARVTYLMGSEFIKHFAAAGGVERTWSLILEPPVIPALLEQPGQYEKGSEQGVDIAKAMIGLEKYFLGTRWSVKSTTSGAKSCALLKPLGDQTVTQINQNVSLVQTFVFRTPPGSNGPAQTGVITVLVAKSPSFTPTLLTHLRMLDRGEGGMTTKLDGQRGEAEIGELDGRKVRRVSVIKGKGDDRLLQSTIVASWSNVTIHIVTTNMDDIDDQAMAALREFTRRLEAASQAASSRPAANSKP